MILDRIAFDQLVDVDYAYVEVPEARKPNIELVNGVLTDRSDPALIKVRSLTGDQRSRLRNRAEMDDKPNPPAGYWRALCCAMGMVDDKGAYLFPNELEGAVRIGKYHPELIERISAKILELSTMTKASRDAAEKKSLEMTTSNGGISSPEPSTLATE